MLETIYKKNKWALACLKILPIKYSLTNNRSIGRMIRMSANDPGDRGSIPGRVISKTKKMVLDPSLLNTQHYKA